MFRALSHGTHVLLVFLRCILGRAAALARSGLAVRSLAGPAARAPRSLSGRRVPSAPGSARSLHAPGPSSPSPRPDFELGCHLLSSDLTVCRLPPPLAESLGRVGTLPLGFLSVPRVQQWASDSENPVSAQSWRSQREPVEHFFRCDELLHS